jgi:hypothetical protein
MTCIEVYGIKKDDSANIADQNENRGPRPSNA